MIKVCDCIMGSGKSSSCINYMNEHPEKRYIYITPYTDEAERIVNACPSLDFREPSDKNPETGWSKSGDTIRLVQLGKNVASTHQCFKFYTEVLLEYIQAGGYTLMIDENVSVLEEYKDICPTDLQLMVDGGYIEKNGDTYKYTGKEYGGKWGREAIRFIKSRNMIEMRESNGASYYYWAIPENLLTAFQDVIIMTYMFEGTDMYYYLKMRNIPYQYIGIRHDSAGYHFSDTLENENKWTGLKEKIHICDRKKLNAIGNDEYALSMHWFAIHQNDAVMEQLKKNISNWFNNINRGIENNKRLWATIGESYGMLRGRGVWVNNLAFNYRATNDYADRVILAYPVNIFTNVTKKNYYIRNGLVYDEDRYALSVMVQWIFRSAVRNGKDIWIYIPSSRMRRLLCEWLDRLEGGEAM